MPESFLSALDGAEHEQVVMLQDRESGLQAILAIHNTAMGPAFGGVRRHEYRNGAEALRDALRLSRAMTYKCAMARVPGGGGKCVVIDQPGFDVAEGYRRLGGHVQNMGGRYYTGPDAGTGRRELSYLAERTSFVTVPGDDGPGDLAEATARGVLAGIDAVVSYLATRDNGFPSDPKGQGYAGLRFAVQGLGEVGYRVAGALRQREARVYASEVRARTLRRAVDDLGVEPIDPSSILEQECEVFVPCAFGGILHDVTIERLRCRAIAGCANNVLASSEHGAQIAGHGILLAPDYIVNSGALILGANYHLTGDRDQRAAIDRIGDELFELFERAENEFVAPTDLADRIAEERIAAASRTGPFFPRERDT